MSHIFRALCQKKPNHWFYLCKKYVHFYSKKTHVLRKKPQLIKWFNLLLLKLTPPQKLLYKPRLFYSNHPIHRNIATSTTWRPATPAPSTPPIRSSTVVEFHHNLKAEDPQEARRHHWGHHRWGQAVIGKDHLWKAVVTKETSPPPPTLLEELARELDAPKQDGVTNAITDNLKRWSLIQDQDGLIILWYHHH